MSESEWRKQYPEGARRFVEALEPAAAAMAEFRDAWRRSCDLSAEKYRRAPRENRA